MAKAESVAYQARLGEEVPEIFYRFGKGTLICPWYRHSPSRGFLRNPVAARKTKMKRNGLRVYQSSNRIDLDFGDNHWSLPAGSFFTAKNKRHAIKTL